MEANSFYEWMVISTKENGNVHFFGVLLYFLLTFHGEVEFQSIFCYIGVHTNQKFPPIIFQTSLKPVDCSHDHINNNKKEQHFICLRRLELWLLIQFFLPSAKNVKVIRLEFSATFKCTPFETLSFLSTHHPFLKECRPNLMMKKQFASLQLVFQCLRSISKKGNLLDNSDANQLEGHVLLKKLWT